MDLMLYTNKNPVNDIDDDDTTEDEDSSGDKYLLVSSSGPAGDRWKARLGLYRKSEDTREGRSVYIKEYDTKNGHILRLFSYQGVWNIRWCHKNFILMAILRASTPSVSPTSVTWQYAEYCPISQKKTWHDDPAITVTSLSEKPSECEITISLPEDVKRDIWEPGVEGVYKADGTYRLGRPVLRHSGGRFTVSAGSCWTVLSGVNGGAGSPIYLQGGSVPSQCQAGPWAARKERRGQTHWNSFGNPGGFPESSGIIVKCNKHTH